MHSGMNFGQKGEAVRNPHNKAQGSVQNALYHISEITFLHKTAHSPFSPGFSSLFRVLERKAENGTCKFEHPKCDSVFRVRYVPFLFIDFFQTIRPHRAFFDYSNAIIMLWNRFDGVIIAHGGCGPKGHNHTQLFWGWPRSHPYHSSYGGSIINVGMKPSVIEKKFHQIRMGQLTFTQTLFNV